MTMMKYRINRRRALGLMGSAAEMIFAVSSGLALAHCSDLWVART